MLFKIIIIDDKGGNLDILRRDNNLTSKMPRTLFIALHQVEKKIFPAQRKMKHLSGVVQ